MLPGKVLCRIHACTFAETDRERGMSDLPEELLQANSYSKLGPKCDRKKHNSVI